jgi:hypothetical protein
MLPMEKSVTFTGACANEIIPKLIFQIEVGVFGWTVVVGSVDRLKICHHMKAVENK